MLASKVRSQVALMRVGFFSWAASLLDLLLVEFLLGFVEGADLFPECVEIHGWSRDRALGEICLRRAGKFDSLGEFDVFLDALFHLV